MTGPPVPATDKDAETVRWALSYLRLCASAHAAAEGHAALDALAARLAAAEQARARAEKHDQRVVNAQRALAAVELDDGDARAIALNNLNDHPAALAAVSPPPDAGSDKP